MNARLPIGILISGTGTNMTAILEAVAQGELACDVKVVISNRADAPGLASARARGAPVEVVPHGAFESRTSFEDALIESLVRHGAKVIVLAGFMRVLTAQFLSAFPDRVVNVHPALLPAFPGVDAQSQALRYGAKVTGATVHWVDDGVDTGPIILQASVPILEGDTREALVRRLLPVEHGLLISALDLIAHGRAAIRTREGRRVVEIAP